VAMVSTQIICAVMSRHFGSKTAASKIADHQQ